MSKPNNNINWVDLDENSLTSQPQTENSSSLEPSSAMAAQSRTLRIVETAFLASTASLVWLINYYFPVGPLPLLRFFFPLPIALLYLRWSTRSAWMGTLVIALLIAILMGPTSSILYTIPYGLLGVQLGWVWRRQGSWYWAIALGSILSIIGFFFRFWLLSIILGEDLWIYVIAQISELADWLFLRLGLLSSPNMTFLQLLAIALLTVNSVLYLFTVHIIALLMLDRLGNPIPRPPHWIATLIDYDT